MNRALVRCGAAALILLLVHVAPATADTEPPELRCHWSWARRPRGWSEARAEAFLARASECLARLESRPAPSARDRAPVVDELVVEITPRFRGHRVTVTLERALAAERRAELRARRESALVPFEEGLAGVVVDLARKLCTPVGSLERGDDDEATAQFAAPLPANIGSGTIFEVFRRPKRRSRGVLLELTWFVALKRSADGRSLSGRLVSGAGAPAGRLRCDEFVAPARLSADAPIRLRLLAAEDGHALAGYRIFLDKPGAAADYLGVTDGRGEFQLKPERPELLTLQIRFNRLVLARIPVAPCLDRGVLELRLRRRADKSEALKNLRRLMQRMEELVLLKEVAAEDVAALALKKKYADAERVLEAFRKDAAEGARLMRSAAAVRNKARSDGQDIDTVYAPVAKRMQALLARLDTSKEAAQLAAVKDRVAARRKAEDLIVAANLARQSKNVEEAISLLKQASLADPLWEKPRRLLAELEQQWKIQSPEHAAARSLVLALEDADATWFLGNLKRLKDALATLKRLRDKLTLETALTTLGFRRAHFNNLSRAALDKKKLKEAKRLNEVALEITPVIDEVSAWLRNAGP